MGTTVLDLLRNTEDIDLYRRRIGSGLAFLAEASFTILNTTVSLDKNIVLYGPYRGPLASQYTMYPQLPGPHGAEGDGAIDNALLTWECNRLKI
jgi:hypothetical protein